MSQKTFKRTIAMWPDPGYYRVGKAFGTLTATASCPSCGKFFSLTDHKIQSDGTVHPSLVCPSEGCNFHEMAILEDWGKETDE